MRRGGSSADLVQASQVADKPTVFTEVTFQIKVETSLSEKVIVVGDCYAIGFWSPTDGFVLSTTPETYPVWTGTATFPTNVPVQYKYAVVRPDADIKWEAIKGNRTFTTTGAALYVDDGIFGELPEAASPRIRVLFSQKKSPKSGNDPIQKYTGRQAGLAVPNSTTVILVLYRLPIVATKTDHGWSFKWDDDALYLTSLALKRGMQGKVHLLWLGYPTVYIPPEDQERVQRTLMDEFNCKPVFLPEKGIVDEHYNGFCKDTLWHMFHNIVDINGPTREFDRRKWQAYCALNTKFAQTIIEVYNEGDMIWIHDYHLLVLPTYIRRRLHAAKIGLFLHTPFPSSEVYRTLPVREDILRGILSASLVGFHLFDYARHFLSACTRMLGLQFESRRGGFLGVEYNGRHVMVRVSHVGIDPERFIQRLETPDVQKTVEELLTTYKGKVLLLGIDDMDKLKGIPLKLLALYNLLTNYTCWQNKVVLIQRTLPKSGRNDEQQQVRDEIAGLVNKINTEFGRDGYRPVDYQERALEFDERVALYSIADAVINTSIRDGLNLTPYEFVCCSRDKGGVLIASEFTGCSRVLSGAIHVNPWNIEEVAAAIDKALSMSLIEKQVKHDKDYQYVTTHTTMVWAESFLSDLDRAAEKADRLTYLSLGLGTGFRVLEFGAGFKKLDVDAVVKSYRNAKRRLLVFDYEGTLTQLGSLAGLSVPSPPVLACLQRLCQDRANTVFIVSGRERKILDRWFRCVPNLGLAAEHGVYYRWNPDEEWLTLSPSVDLSWMEIAHSIFQEYTERTDGSYIEAKESALVWHYRDADPDFGLMQAKELHDHLDNVLSNFPVQVVNGKNIVEVKPKGINKGVMVEKLIADITSAGQAIDFALVLGDDRSDEDMFAALDTFFGPQMASSNSSVTATSCTVGRKPSHAKYFLDNYEEANELLVAVASARQRSSSRGSFNSLDTFGFDKMGSSH
mmetsp:Transcript_4596/g.7114  ORF Transcript_4596/g.7114 Transcript_4596/m.7114 type:complete len:963 (+) Transcript_4596:113-3001(+)|eukprot:CAMPEP_0184657502 /NCGR_PEP_ID=MMETSP0308-20130426/20257_1 /TAXON_ID=38269 /ORGANISM="Gloeochaete witrockiana, Strain SAG 46.84" /LENGTH=962 /DNA_ID=CAMNT_0027095443 /DNA_START=63 /DNA_END=2951 /DNA_ORIENTATION=-